MLQLGKDTPTHINKQASVLHHLINFRVAFHYMDEDMIKKLIEAMICPRFECATVVWSPHKKKTLGKLKEYRDQ